MDPLDPLTEISRSGQAISPFIFLERLVWLFIGFFFIGAMTSGLKTGLNVQGWLNNNRSFIGVNKKPDKKNASLNEDNE